jgi:hypothetical protein
MNNMQASFPRRTFLRGLGATVGLPLLESLAPVRALGSGLSPEATPVRLAFRLRAQWGAHAALDAVVRGGADRSSAHSRAAGTVQAGHGRADRADPRQGSDRTAMDRGTTPGRRRVGSPGRRLSRVKVPRSGPGCRSTRSRRRRSDAIPGCPRSRSERSPAGRRASAIPGTAAPIPTTSRGGTRPRR